MGNTRHSGRLLSRAAGWLGAFVLCIAMTVLPAMAQGEVLINPDALQKLQNAAPADGGVHSIRVTAGEFFTGGSGNAPQLVEGLKKYQPASVTSAGNNGSDCLFQDGNGSLLITFESSGGTLYVTVDGYSMDGIIAGILATNSRYAAQADTAGTGSAAGASSSGSTGTADISSTPRTSGSWILDAAGWWYDNGNGTWPANGWYWIDGNQDGVSECYYFNESGYILLNTTTPDGYQVNGDGAWMQDGVVQVQ